MNAGSESAQILRTARAIIEDDHFVYVSGDHGSGWIDKDAICTRGNAFGEAAIGVKDFRYLLEYKIPSWAAAECNLCRDGVPVNTHYAHGLEFVEQLQCPKTQAT